MVSKFIAAASKNEPISIYGDGKQTRTFCFINDNVDACLNAFYQDKYVNDVVNIGGDIEISILDLANTIIKICNSTSKIKFLPALEEGDMTRRKPDTSKMKLLLNRKPLSLEDGLKKLLENTQFIL